MHKRGISERSMTWAYFLLLTATCTILLFAYIDSVSDGKTHRMKYDSANLALINDALLANPGHTIALRYETHPELGYAISQGEIVVFSERSSRKSDYTTSEQSSVFSQRKDNKLVLEEEVLL